MADLTITATSVVPGDGAKKELGVFGETVTAGQSIYRKASDRKFWLADADSPTAEVREVYGIALNGGAANQVAVVQTEGEINLGATLQVGAVYLLSDTPGGIMPAVDQGDGDYTVVIGVAETAAILRMGIKAAGAPFTT